jgi:4-oxalocrotonate tautomerase
VPEVIVYAVKGRTSEQKKKLLRGITRAFSESFEIDPADVVVQIVESEPDSKAKGGIPFDER